MAVTIGQLVTYCTFARTRSVRAAAEDLVVSQPSVSAALAALSRALGVALTEPAGRGLRLSAAGEAYLPFARDVVGLLEEGREAAREAAGASAQHLRLAAVTTAAEFLVPPLLQAFAARHRDVVATLDVGNRRRVVERLLDHEADVAIGGRPPPDTLLRGVPFLHNEMCLISAVDDPATRRRRVPLDTLAERTWLLREEGSGTRSMVEDYLASRELDPPTLTLGSNGAIRQAVRIGLGIALQSRVAVELELRSGLVSTIRVADDLPEREWYALHHAAPVRRSAVEAFLAFVATDGAKVVRAASKREHLTR